MKKIIFSASILVLVFAGYVFAAEIETTSKISQVTVYPDSALLTRVANLKLSPGEYKVIFPNIIPDVDENSLRISAPGSKEVKLFGAQLKKEFLEDVSAAKVKELKEAIQKLEDEGRHLQDYKTLLSEEKSFLDSVRLFSGNQIPKDLITRMPVAKDLEETLKFLDAKLKDNYAQAQDCEIQARELNKKLDALRRELSEIGGTANKLKRSIIVELQVAKSADFNLDVSYLVRGAFWQPIYDARADFEKAEVEMVSYGIVKQTTGEDWQDVDMALSTAKPAIGGRMPYVAPWFIRPAQPAVRESRALGIMAKAASAPRMMQQYEAFDTNAAKGGAEPEVQYAQAEEKGTAVTYKLPRKTSVKSDGSEHKLPVSSQVIKAEFEYSTYPRLVPNAYLGSRVTNSEGLQLLAGRVNVFLDGDFVGTSSIDNIGPGEEFDLYLGVDENVKVKRELVQKKVDDVLIAGIPSPTRKTTYRYKISLENYKSRKIKSILFEALPVSENERIKVKIEHVSLEPKEKDWKDRKGIWRWELNLAPKAKQEITYSFTVEHPRDMQVEGL